MSAALLCFLSMYSGASAAAIGDGCLVVGATCMAGDKDNVVVVHGRRVQESHIICNSKKVCVDTTNKVEIATGIWMPSVNLGTCCGSEPSVGLPSWLSAGGTGIDTAYDYYDSEDIAAVLKQHPHIKRSSLFITTKVPGGLSWWTNGHSLDSPQPPGCSMDPKTSLNFVRAAVKSLGTTPDLVLMHRPCSNPAETLKQWEGLELARKEGLTRAIGVSEFNVAQLQAIMKAGPKPSVNQCSMNVNYVDQATLDFCKKHGIVYEAFYVMKGCPWNSAALKKVASRHGATSAQVCIRFILDKGAVLAVGTGSNADHVATYAKQDLGVYSFKLTPKEVLCLQSRRVSDC